jgi:hypothetical protein
MLSQQNFYFLNWKSMKSNSQCKDEHRYVVA